MDRHPSLEPFKSTAAGHQPLLFGNAGYWSKISCVDTHIATFGVPYRKHDQLSHLRLPDQSQVSLGLKGHYGDEIERVQVARNLDKMRRAFEQNFLSKRFPFRERAEGILDALDVELPCSYLYLWCRVFTATATAAGLRICTKLDTQQDPGEDTQARLERRIGRTIPAITAYVSGPGAYGYLKREPVVPLFIHRMNDPTERSFVQHIVCEEDPLAVLRNFKLEPWHVPTERAEHQEAVSGDEVVRAA